MSDIKDLICGMKKKLNVVICGKLGQFPTFKVACHMADHFNILNLAQKQYIKYIKNWKSNIGIKDFYNPK